MTGPAGWPSCRRALRQAALVLLVLGASLPMASLARSSDEKEAEESEEEPREVLPPIGVFGERVHHRRGIKLSFRYEHLSNAGLLIGDERVDPEAYLLASSYQEVPFSSSEDRVTFEVAWVPADELTLVLRVPFVDKEAVHLIEEGGGVRAFGTRATGFGDVNLSLLYHVYQERHARLHLNLGLNLPSGSSTVSSTRSDPMVLERLPYSMQLGSGTVDLIPGFTYNGDWKLIIWGAQVEGELRAGTNNQGYTLGNRYRATSWLGVRWVEWMHAGFRLEWMHWFNAEGGDPLMDPTRSPDFDSMLLAGRRLDTLFSLDFYAPFGPLAGTRVSIEGGLPAYQNLDGPQLRAEWLLTVGLQYAF